MRVFKWVAVAIAVLFTGIGVFSYVREGSFQAAVPAEQPSLPSVLPVRTASTIVLPVRIALDAIRLALDSGVQTADVQEQHDTIPVLNDDTTRLTWNRGPFALADNAGKLTLGTALSGNLRVDGKILFTHNSAEATVKGTASISAAPVLKEDWTIKPNLSDFQINLEQADLKVFGIHVSVKDKASELVKQKVAEKLPGLEDRIAGDASLRNAIAKEWAGICQSRLIAAPDPSLPPTFVEVKPNAASAAQLGWDDKNVNLVLGIEASLRVTDQATTPQCPFPEKLKIVPPPNDGRLALNVPIDFTFETINLAARKLLVGRTIVDEGRGIDVVIHSISLRPSGRRLLATADLTVRRAGILGFLQGSASGTVYLLATPVLDVASKTVRLPDARLDVGSSRALTSVFGQVAAAAVETVLKREAGFDYGRGLADARSRIVAAVADINSKLGPFRLDVKMGELAVDGLAFDGDRITVTAVAVGTVRGEVVTVPLASHR